MCLNCLKGGLGLFAILYIMSSHHPKEINYENNISTVVVNSSTNINKTKKSSLTLTGLTEHKKNTIYGNSAPGSGQLQQCGRVKPVNLCTLTLCTRWLLFQIWPFYVKSDHSMSNLTISCIHIYCLRSEHFTKLFFLLLHHRESWTLHHQTLIHTFSHSASPYLYVFSH